MTAAEFLSDPRYPYAEFLEDLRALGECTWTTSPAGEIARRYPARFRSRYPDPKVRAWRFARCYGAARFWTVNRDALNVGNPSVLGNEEALIMGKMMLGLWIYWMTTPGEPVPEPSPEAFIMLCDVVELQIDRFRAPPAPD